MIVPLCLGTIWLLFIPTIPIALIDLSKNVSSSNLMWESPSGKILLLLIVEFSLIVSKAVVTACILLCIIAVFFIEFVAVVIFPSWLKLSGKLGVIADAVVAVVLSAGFPLRYLSMGVLLVVQLLCFM